MDAATTVTVLAFGGTAAILNVLMAVAYRVGQ